MIHSRLSGLQRPWHSASHWLYVQAAQPKLVTVSRLAVGSPCATIAAHLAAAV